ncbi:MAG: class I SAM-dependent methyltransferase [Archangium sp.]
MTRLWVWAIATSVVFACASNSKSAAPPPAEQAPHPSFGGHDWDSVYRRGTGFSQKETATLAQAITGEKPGRALDVGMGQGRNALFLARKGWTVTGFDVSSVGVEQAKAVAKNEGLSLDAQVADADAYDYGTAKWDLVALIYVGGADLAAKVDASLKPGGLVVVEFFHKDMEGPHGHSMGAFATGELKQLFAGYEIIRDEVVDDVAEWGGQRSKLVRFVARKK